MNMVPPHFLRNNLIYSHNKQSCAITKVTGVGVDEFELVKVALATATDCWAILGDYTVHSPAPLAHSRAAAVCRPDQSIHSVSCDGANASCLV